MSNTPISGRIEVQPPYVEPSKVLRKRASRRSRVLRKGRTPKVVKLAKAEAIWEAIVSYRSTIKLWARTRAKRHESEARRELRKAHRRQWQQKIEQQLWEDLKPIIAPALVSLNSKPFKKFVTVIDALKNGPPPKTREFRREFFVQAHARGAFDTVEPVIGVQDMMIAMRVPGENGPSYSKVRDLFLEFQVPIKKEKAGRAKLSHEPPRGTKK